MKNLRCQQDIISNWKDDTLQPLISICCLAYNHQEFICDALNGFLNQETEYPFEIVINDDASTDKTAEIIRSYEEKYPRIIRAIYQTENQYSKGVNVGVEFNLKLGRGEYFALCEGDDFWINPYKLQTQIDAMKRNPQCDISCHPAVDVYKDASDYGPVIKRNAKSNKIYTTHEVLRGGGGFSHTGSLVIKKNAIDLFVSWDNGCAPAGDVFLQAFGALRGGMLYIDKAMSARRRKVSGSRSYTLKKADAKVKESIIKKTVESYNRLKDVVDNKYINDIQYRVSFLYYSLAMRYCRDNNYDFAKYYLEKSWSKYPFMSLKQVVLYLLRNKYFILLKYFSR